MSREARIAEVISPKAGLQRLTSSLRAGGEQSLPPWQSSTQSPFLTQSHTCSCMSNNSRRWRRRARADIAVAAVVVAVVVVFGVVVGGVVVVIGAMVVES